MTTMKSASRLQRPRSKPCRFDRAQLQSSRLLSSVNQELRPGMTVGEYGDLIMQNIYGTAPVAVQ